jgi:hypothetical protein
MMVHFGQIYIEPGVHFPFSHHFQRRLSEEITALVEPSAVFRKKYGNDFGLTFNVSAKRGISDNEIRGPAVFKKTKDVEYTIFLPFGVITRSSEAPTSALQFLLKGTCSVFESLGIGTAKIEEQRDLLIEQICLDSTMFE